MTVCRAVKEDPRQGLVSTEVLPDIRSPSQTSRRLCRRSEACGGPGWRRQMGLLHMGQTLRISNHFSRHLGKVDGRNTGCISMFGHLKSMKLRLGRNWKESRHETEVSFQRSVNGFKTGLIRQDVQDIYTVYRCWRYR